jgi:predicted NBD/HSP70 family sugar kinase
VSLQIAVDLGGTKGRVAAYESDGLEPVAYEEFKVQKVEKDATPEEKYAAFRQDFSELCRIIEEMTGGHPNSISIVVAGVVDKDRTHILAAGNIVHWAGRRVVRRLHGKFGLCPVILGNDAEGAALAEALYGHGMDQDFLLAIWGSGVGGCRIHWVDGQPIALPTELGHQLTRGDSGILCGCGSRSCLEAWCGGDNIVKRHSCDIVKRHSCDLSLLSRKEWELYRLKMVNGLYNSLVHHPVPLLVFSGGVICKQRWMVPLIEADLQRELRIVSAPQVTISAHGEEAGTLGALALGRRLLNGNTVAVS